MMLAGRKDATPGKLRQGVNRKKGILLALWTEWSSVPRPYCFLLLHWMLLLWREES